MIPALYSRLPLTERVTYYYDFVSAIFFGIYQGLALPLIPIIARKMGMNTAMLAVIAIFPFIGNLVSIYFGHLSEKHRKMPFVFWPAIIARSSLFLVFFVDAPMPFLIVLGLFFIVGNIGGPAYASIMRAGYRPEYRGMLMGNIRVQMMLVSALFTYLAGKLLQFDERAYRLIFPAAAVFGIVNSLIFRNIRVRGENTKTTAVRRRSSFGGSIGILRQDKTFIMFLLIVFLVAFPNKITIPVEPIRFVDELLLDYESAGIIQGTIVFVMSIAGYLFWNFFTKKSNPILMLAAAGVLTALRDFSIAIAKNDLGLIPGAALLGFSNAAWDLMPLFIIMRFAGPGRLSLYFGLHLGLVGFRGIAGPILGSIMYSTLGFSTVSLYMISFAFTGLGCVLLFIFASRMKKHEFGTEGEDGEPLGETARKAG